MQIPPTDRQTRRDAMTKTAPQPEKPVPRSREAGRLALLPQILRNAIAPLAVALTAVVWLPSVPVLREDALYLSFVPAVMISAVIGGPLACLTPTRLRPLVFLPFPLRDPPATQGGLLH